ncbi:trihelix transcription factor ASIL2-like [Panicum miliaceum]|uniref:Trihelix transcription factor ASIL2-like n=1 Tax=Panicum miliaceum TaxID=4540 RepID=A0A3L6RWS8_PANMI|nr:trihelix transcription factor ASIL2-like [Panicum miliaceum]
MDDDGAASPSPSPSPSRSPSPLPVADPVTVAAAPPGHVAVAIPLRRPSPSSGGGGGGGGREDAWSDGATSTLIDAWGERFVALGRGSLRHPQWQEVAEVVSSRDGYSKGPRSDIQCKNRIDTLKKKYKVEKAKRSSSWPYFDRLDDLLAPVYKANSSSSSAARSALPMVPPRINFPQRTRTPLQPSAAAKRRMPSPPPQASASSDSSDGFPPEPLSALANGKRQRLEEPTPAAAANGAESSSSRVQGLRDLAQAIRRLGEVFERVESAKREQELRMEQERLEAARELEEQRVEFFLKMQMELSKATGSGSAAPVAVPIPADGNGTRRTGMAAEVATSSNHRVRYRIKGSMHHQAAPQPHYQNNAASGGNGSDSDNKEAEEDAEDEEEESQ